MFSRARSKRELRKVVRMAQWRWDSVTRRAAASLVIAACGCSVVPRTQLERARDANADLQMRLDQSGAQVAEARREANTHRQETLQLQEQLDASRQLRDVLEQRVENFRRDSERLHAELTRMTMSGGNRKTSAVALASATTPDEAGFRLAPEFSRALEAFAASQPGVSFLAADRLCRWHSQTLFSSGDQLSQQSRIALREFARLMNSNVAANLNLLLVGHTASSTADFVQLAAHHPTDWHLAAHQAIAVQQFLEEVGLSPERVGIVSYGSQQPLVSVGDDVARGANARLEFYIMPPDPPSNAKAHTAAKPAVAPQAPPQPTRTSSNAGDTSRPRLQTRFTR